MNKSITIPFILQTLLTQEEVEKVVKLVGYEDKARKFTVYHLLQYWCMAAIEEWNAIGRESIMPVPVACPTFIIQVFRAKLRRFHL
ncbi:hypothetical protein QIH01_23730 [Brevibacillus brevis]|uniref:hypothetical protein n=1 Tax=Brevibacillus brevis TaxID=1393 RepID=UPI0007D8B0B8|nr:hypothetical protein [Brevibacillus brevis]WGV58459.1 hypothetical protein QIH01_23730 [Brevibacillus brevis]